MSTVSSLRPEQPGRPYLTVIPDRTPREKVYTRLSHARAAISGRYYMPRGAALYEWNEDANDWTLLFEVPPGERIARGQFPWQKP